MKKKNDENDNTTYPSDLFPERSVEGSSGGDDLREAGGAGEAAAELGAGTDVGDAVKSLRPPLVPLDPQPGHLYSIIHQQPYLLRQCQPSDEVSGPLMDRQRNSTERKVSRRPILGVACERIPSFCE